MNNLNFLIYQGSTPTMELVLPLELDVDDAAVATLRQGDVDVLEWALNETPRETIAGSGTLALHEEDPSVLLLAMTQADTLALTPGDAELQLRVVTGEGADTFLPVVGAVGPAFRGGVIV